MSEASDGTLTLSPGTYLRLRRQAAGLCVLDVAVRLAAPGKTADMVRSLNALEADEYHVTEAILRSLRCAFAFDPAIYAQLLDLHVSNALTASMLPHPQLCRVCGCSWHDACRTDGGPCSWCERDLCSGCAPATAAPTPDTRAAA